MIAERLRKLIDAKTPQRGGLAELAQKTGIDRSTLSRLRNGKTTASADSLAALCGLFPQYTLWLMTGETNEAGGQTSPDLEKLRELQESLSGEAQKRA